MLTAKVKECAEYPMLVFLPKRLERVVLDVADRYRISPESIIIMCVRRCIDGEIGEIPQNASLNGK